MNQAQPNQYTMNIVNHGEPTDNQPQSARIYFEGNPDERVNFDLSHLADTQNFKLIQTVFIDNYGNDGDLIIEIPDTQQRIICKANKQGYFPVLSYTRLKVSVKQVGTKKMAIPIYFMNFIIAQGSW